MISDTHWRNGDAQKRYELAGEVLTSIAAIREGDISSSAAASSSSSHVGGLKGRRALDVLHSRMVEVQSDALGTNTFDRNVAIGAALGYLCSLGVALTLFVPSVRGFGLFLAFTALFHLLEYHYVAAFHPKDLEEDSFLINHSFEFKLAMASALIEYWLEWLLWPSLKASGSMLLLLACFVAAMQAMRTSAMWTAGSHFHHLVRTQRGVNQHLVTSGIYSVFRHPSYVAWFYWSIGLQLLLCNPLNVFLWAAASWRFFNDRIPKEEATLIRFFGEEYKSYMKTSYLGIPGIKSGTHASEDD